MRVRISIDPDRTRLRGGALRGVKWSALQKVGTRSASLLTFIVLARMLEPQDFGLVALASAIVMVITMLFDLSLPQYLIQQVELTRRVIDTAFWCAVALSIVAALVIIACAPLVATLLTEPRLTPVLVALACTVPLGSLSAVPQALLRRSLAFDVISKRSLVGIAASGVVGVSLAASGAGVWALVLQTYAQLLVSIVLFYGVAQWRPGLSWDRRESVAMVRYGTTLWGMSSLHFLRLRGDELVVGAILGSVSLGIYSVAKRMVLFVSDLIGGVVLQVVPSVLAAAKADPERVRRGYLTAIGASAAMIAPVTMGLAAVSGVLVPLVFGRQWQGSGAIAQVAAIAAAAIILTQFDRGLFLALDLPRVELKNMVITAVLGVGAAAAAAPWGLMSVVLATTGCSYLAWAWRIRVTQRCADIPARKVLATLAPVWFAALLAAALAWGTLLGLGSWSSWGDLYALLLSGAVLAVAYPPLLRLLARPTVANLQGFVPARLQRSVATKYLLRYLLGRPHSGAARHVAA